METTIGEGKVRKNNNRNTRVILSEAMGLDQLQLFVRFCNLSGLLPFRMILDEQTRRFKRFEGHWRNAANWWCSFVIVSQLLAFFGNIYILIVLILPEHKELSLVQHFVHSLYFSNYFFFILLSPRLFLFRFRHFETAFEFLHRIDRMIGTAGSSCTTRRRTIIGILIIFIDV